MTILSRPRRVVHLYRAVSSDVYARTADGTPTPTSMFALVLYLTLGWHAAAAEVLAELALGLVIYGGGGGRRIRRTLRTYRDRSLHRRVLHPGSI